MSQADLEDLILQSTQRAQEMSELARHGMEGLASVELASQNAANKLEVEVAQTRSLLAGALKLIDTVQAEIDRRDQEVHQSLLAVDADCARVEKEVGSKADALRAANSSLLARADAHAQWLGKQVAICQTEVSELKTLAETELNVVRAQTAAAATLVGKLRREAADTQKVLNDALKELQQEHAELDKALEKQLLALEAAYDQAALATEKRLTRLEEELKAIIHGGDEFMDVNLVSKVATDLRKAADAFSRDLGTVEKDVNEIASSISSSHNNFITNLTRHVQPSILDLNKGLFDAARNLGWVH